MGMIITDQEQKAAPGSKGSLSGYYCSMIF